MSNFLKQSTAVTIKLGPFLDNNDGVTEKTGLTPAIKISQSNGSLVARLDSGTIGHDANGWYSIPLSSTDVANAGPWLIISSNTSVLPVWREMTVVPANVYNAMTGTSALAVDVQNWHGTPVIACNVSGVPVVDSNWIAHVSADYPVKVNSNLKKNTQDGSFPFVMTDVNLHKPTASLAVNAFRSIDGNAFATAASSVVEVANGVYYLPVCATDVNGNHIMFRFTATSADDTLVHVVTDP